MKKIFLLFITLFSFVIAEAQTISSTLDKKTLALGEVATMRITITGADAAQVISAPKNELLPFHFEEVKDSTRLGTDGYERTVEFAVFDEGKFTVPALDFKVEGKTLKTIPYEIEVVNTAKKEDQISDIMGNREVKLNASDYWDLYKLYILAAIALIALAIALYYILRYARRQKSSPVVLTNQTLKELDALKKKKYIETNNYRAFYVELLDITRGYLTRQYLLPADVLLTDDLIHLMRTENSIAPEYEQILEEVFMRGDLVKFAKTIPESSVMEKDFADIRNFVKNSAKEVEAEQLRSGV